MELLSRRITHKFLPEPNPNTQLLRISAEPKWDIMSHFNRTSQNTNRANVERLLLTRPGNMTTPDLAG